MTEFMTKLQREYRAYYGRAEASGEPPLMFVDFVRAVQDCEVHYDALWRQVQNGDDRAWDDILRIERRLCL